MLTASRILGDQVGSTAPVFLAFLAIHVTAGLTAIITGAAAALSRKGSPRHIQAGRWYYRAITVVFATATILAAMRWRQDYYLFIIGAVAFTAATIGYQHRRRHRPGDTGHIAGMGIALRRHAHRVLCRQRPPPAAVGPPADVRVLAPALGHRSANHHPCHPARQARAQPATDPPGHDRQPTTLTRAGRRSWTARTDEHARFREQPRGSARTARCDDPAQPGPRRSCRGRRLVRGRGLTSAPPPAGRVPPGPGRTP